MQEENRLPPKEAKKDYIARNGHLTNTRNLDLILELHDPWFSDGVIPLMKLVINKASSALFNPLRGIVRALNLLCDGPNKLTAIDEDIVKLILDHHVVALNHSADELKILAGIYKNEIQGKFDTNTASCLLNLDLALLTDTNFLAQVKTLRKENYSMDMMTFFNNQKEIFLCVDFDYSNTLIFTLLKERVTTVPSSERSKSVYGDVLMQAQDHRNNKVTLDSVAKSADNTITKVKLSINKAWFASTAALTEDFKKKIIDLRELARINDNKQNPEEKLNQIKTALTTIQRDLNNKNLSYYHKIFTIPKLISELNEIQNKLAGMQETEQQALSASGS